jgi:hypothetical protein
VFFVTLLFGRKRRLENGKLTNTSSWAKRLLRTVIWLALISLLLRMAGEDICMFSGDCCIEVRWQGKEMEIICRLQTSLSPY